MPAKKTKTEKKVAEAFREVHANVPSTVKATGKTGKAKEAMLTAVALIDMLSTQLLGSNLDGDSGCREKPGAIPATLVCCPGGIRGLVFAHATPNCVGGFTPIASATAYPPRTHAFTGV